MNQKIQRTSIHVNKKANFDYETIETLEAGVILHGWEIKSLREKSTNLKDNEVSHLDKIRREIARFFSNQKILLESPRRSKLDD